MSINSVIQPGIGAVDRVKDTVGHGSRAATVCAEGTATALTERTGSQEDFGASVAKSSGAGSEIAQPDCISEAYCLQAESNHSQNETQVLSRDGPPQAAD